MTKLLPLALALAACTQTAPGAPDAGTASVRLAYFVADLPSRVEICFVVPGENVGPLTHLLGLPSLEYAHVTRYFDVAAGETNLRILAANAPECSPGIRPDLPVSIPEGRSTIAISGLAFGAPPFDLRALVIDDDPPDLPSGFRAVNLAANQPTLEVGTVCDDDMFEATAVDYGVPGPYVARQFADCVVEARVPGGAEFARTAGLASIGPGQFGTAYAFGASVLFCSDIPPAEPLSACVP